MLTLYFSSALLFLFLFLFVLSQNKIILKLKATCVLL